MLPKEKKKTVFPPKTENGSDTKKGTKTTNRIMETLGNPNGDLSGRNNQASDAGLASEGKRACNYGNGLRNCSKCSGKGLVGMFEHQLGERPGKEEHGSKGLYAESQV